jgi:hypothetical protein
MDALPVSEQQRSVRDADRQSGKPTYGLTIVTQDQQASIRLAADTFSKVYQNIGRT